MSTFTRRKFMGLATSAAGLTLLGAAPERARRERAATQPNLLFVFGDQWRRHALGFMNEDPVLTPRLDQFARESMVFTNALSCCPLCSPYRAMLMTGRYPMSTGVVTNNILLSPDETSFADVLKKSGYATGYIGKWHLDGEPWNHFTPPGPRRQGFDFWYANGCFHPHFQLCYWQDSPEPITGLGWQPDHETDVAIDFIKRHDKAGPFALFMSWAPPHTIHGAPRFDPQGKEFQYSAPERFEALYENRTLPRRPNVKDDYYADAQPGYFGAITSLDENFGRLLDCLAEQGLSDNTIVVFTADHGEMLGSHGAMTKGGPYEESIGIPFLIRWPNHVKAGREDLLFNTVDVMPSVLGLMGQPIPRRVEGTNYSAAMRGETVKRPSSALIEYFHNEKELMKGWRGLRTPRYTFVVNQGTANNGGVTKRRLWASLYDNQEDPYQLKPVVAEEGANPQMAPLWNELREWMRRTNDPWFDTEGVA